MQQQLMITVGKQTELTRARELIAELGEDATTAVSPLVATVLQQTAQLADNFINLATELLVETRQLAANNAELIAERDALRTAIAAIQASTGVPPNVPAAIAPATEGANDAS